MIMERGNFIRQLLSERAGIKDWCNYLSKYNYHIGQEIFSEAITIAIEKCEKCEEGKVKQWVAGIARNLMMRHKALNCLWKFTDEPTELSLSNKVTYQENQFETDYIYSAINRLTAKEKEIIQLHVDGYKHSDISEKLGITLGYVKSRICTIRKSIHKQLS